MGEERDVRYAVTTYHCKPQNPHTPHPVSTQPACQYLTPRSHRKKKRKNREQKKGEEEEKRGTKRKKGWTKRKKRGTKRKKGGRRDEGTKGQRNEGTKGRRDEGTKGTKGRGNKGTRERRSVCVCQVQLCLGVLSLAFGCVPRSTPHQVYHLLGPSTMGPELCSRPW